MKCLDRKLEEGRLCPELNAKLGLAFEGLYGKEEEKRVRGKGLCLLRLAKE